MFFKGCAEAGPSNCAFYEPTSAAILSRFESLSKKIASRPIPVRTETSYGLVDHARLRSTIFNALYGPYVKFPILAAALASLEKGDGAPLFKMLERPMFECACGDDDMLPPMEAQTAILCNDGDPLPNTLEDTERHVKKLAESSPWYDVWASIRISCS
jgi:hypothetical protein